jgi:hypothetical protein
MRSWTPLLLVLVVASGCTSVQLRNNTVRQVGTLTHLQHQVVLNNMAAYTCNPDAIPFQANLRIGATQIVDSASTSMGRYIGEFTALLGLSRTAVNQWMTAPVTDEATLRLLRIAYRRSLGYEEDLYTDDLANRFAHRFKMQIAAMPDMAVENAHMFARGPALPQLLDRAGWKGETQPGFTGSDPSVNLWHKDTTDIISSNSDRIVQVGEVLTADNLTVAPLLTGGLPSLGPDEKTPRVVVATPYATEIRRQVLSLNNYLLEIHPGWFGLGQKRDVPKCACYVGHNRDCGCDRYVWVLPEGRREFEEFTLKILRISTMVPDINSAGYQGGVMYSPPISAPGGAGT